MFFADAQFVFSRRKHHWHRRGKNVEMFPLTACLSKGKRKGCRQNFPRTKELTNRVKVVCPGVAFKHDLHVSGRRNALGSILGRRSCQWISGTAPGFAVVFRSNTNTMPNMRLPITEKTHDVACTRACLTSAGSLTHLCKRTQRAQRQMAGYFCGYTSKRQPVGIHELKAASDGMAYIHEKLQRETGPQQFARTVNKMAADLEARGTLRTAAETFNLAVNMDEQDATQAEFIRTFRTVDFPGKLFLDRLELERKKQAATGAVVSMLPRLVNLTSKDHVAPTPWVELYGFRGQHPDLYHLSPWEFFQYWRPVPLQPPRWYQVRRQEPLTMWLPGGEAFCREHEHDDPPTFLDPGEHYVVRGDLENHITYPDDPELHRFRHEWVLQRSKRPLVPRPVRTPMPNASNDREGKARLFSVYLRCYVLSRRHATRHVPHMSDLDVVPQRRRIRNEKRVVVRQFRPAWKDYVRVHVVSEHARRIIMNFMSACGGFSTGEKDSDAEAQVEAPTTTLPGVPLSVGRVHQLVTQDATVASGVTGGGGEEALKPLAAPLRAAVERGEQLWGRAREGTARPDGETLDRSGHRDDYAPKGAGEAGTTDTLRGQAPGAPSGQDTRGTTRGQASGDPSSEGTRGGRGSPAPLTRGADLYQRFRQTSADAWVRKLQTQKEAPNREQLQGITSVIQRCALEAGEQQRDQVNSDPAEPSREMVHGLPGAGKSRVIHWMKEFFTDVLGWEHGVHFVVLASQNTMAALVGGRTLHSWGNIPINKEMAAARKAKVWAKLDANPMYEKAVYMRWILIDEGSTASAEVLGALDSTLQQAVRATGTYARRGDGSKRPFGGINLRIFTDWWQLPPVNATAITQNPLQRHSATVQRTLAMFWSRDEDSLTGMQELVKEIRCRDPWLSDFLRECRVGEQQWGMYWFVHGFPTENTGSWMVRSRQPECGEPRRAKLAADVWPRMRQEGATWEQRRRLECGRCQDERARRARVMLTEQDTRHESRAFLAAPYVHPYNAPKYHAQQRRAMIFAQAMHKCLLWVVAWDSPQNQEDKALKGDALQKARERWLQFHDQQTSGIIGSPAIGEGNAHPFHRHGGSREGHAQEQPRHPDGLGVAAAGRAADPWRGGCGDGPVGEATLPLRPHPWRQVDDVGDARGEHLPSEARVEDLGTRQGATRQSAQVRLPDCARLQRHGAQLHGRNVARGHRRLPRLEAEAAAGDMLKACNCVSRVRAADDLLLVQPYNPWLFKQGQLTGPSLLMELWRGNVAERDLPKGWVKFNGTKLTWRSVEEMPLRCWSCSTRAGKEKMLPLKDFASENKWGKTVGRGADAICAPCARQHAAKRQANEQWLDHRREAGFQARNAAVRCVKCEREEPEGDFEAASLAAWREQRNTLRDAVCKECTVESKVRCTRCEREKPEGDFDAASLESWRKHRNTLRDAVCKECALEQKSVQCTRCGKEKPEADFDRESLGKWRRNRTMSTEARCNSCSTAPQEERAPGWDALMRKWPDRVHPVQGGAAIQFLRCEALGAAIAPQRDSQGSLLALRLGRSEGGERQALQVPQMRGVSAADSILC